MVRMTNVDKSVSVSYVYGGYIVDGLSNDAVMSIIKFWWGYKDMLILPILVVFPILWIFTLVGAVFYSMVILGNSVRW